MVVSHEFAAGILENGVEASLVLDLIYHCMYETVMMKP